MVSLAYYRLMHVVTIIHISSLKKFNKLNSKGFDGVPFRLREEDKMGQIK